MSDRSTGSEIPSAELRGSETTFLGRPIPDSWAFFEPPRTEIGDVIMAETTLRKGEDWRASQRKIHRRIIAISVFVGLAGSSIGYLDMHSTPVFCFFLFAIIAYLSGLLVGSAFYSFKHCCSYVGQSGIQVSYLTGERNQKLTTEVLRFEEAFDSVGSFKEINHDRTEELEWRREDGSRLLRLKTAHATIDFTRVTGHLHRLIATSNLVWMEVIWARMIKQWNAGEPLIFRLKKNDTISLSRGLLSITQSGKAKDYPTGVLKELKLRQARFELVTREADWVGLKGRFYAHYWDIGNACVLKQAFDALLMGERYDQKQTEHDSTGH